MTLDNKRAALQDLAKEIELHSDNWLFPAQGCISGFFGTGPVFIVGDQPSTSPWPESHPNRKAFYGHLEKTGLADAHLTDLYKRRGLSGQLRDGIPEDFLEHVRTFRREIDILRPTRIIALGLLARRLLYTHVPECRPMLTRIWHFSYVVRYGKIPLYEANIRRALTGI
jgi:hypothetical protein